MNLLDIENALIDLAAKVRAERTKPEQPPEQPPVLPSLPPLGPSNPLIPNIPGMTPTPLPSGSDPAPSGPAPTGDGGGYDRPFFDFRNGDILRITGNGARNVVATHPAMVSFSVGESGGAGGVPRHVVVRVNGYTRDEQSGNYVVTDPVPVKAGEGVVVSVSGDGDIISSVRLALQ